MNRSLPTIEHEALKTFSTETLGEFGLCEAIGRSLGSVGVRHLCVTTIQHKFARHRVGRLEVADSSVTLLAETRINRIPGFTAAGGKTLAHFNVTIGLSQHHVEHLVGLGLDELTVLADGGALALAAASKWPQLGVAGAVSINRALKSSGTLLQR